MGPRKPRRLARHIELVKRQFLSKIGRPFTYPLQEMDVNLLNLAYHTTRSHMILVESEY